LANARPCQGTVACYELEAVFVLREGEAGRPAAETPVGQEYTQFLAAKPTRTLNATVPWEASGVAIMLGATGPWKGPA
jgi:hypothetical protein